MDRAHTSLGWIGISCLRFLVAAAVALAVGNFVGNQYGV
jgi:hypothetical protein